MDAYSALLRAHEPAARRLARVLCGDDGDDAAQEAFVKGWSALPGFRGDASFRSWLLRIVANEAHNRRRSTGRRAARELRLAETGAEASAETTALLGEQRQRLLGAVNALPDKLRDAVACRHLLELSEAETAVVLGVPVGTVKSRISRGLDRLRAALEVDRA
ncbi:MAG TPA: RNA polymerase sigma factor [Acidimicrobiales bacterium]|nr:RNA polymerase sigma factor [Acidimicrobiales bacterium]